MRLFLSLLIIFIFTVQLMGQDEEKDSLNFSLMEAAYEGKTDTVLQLIKAGADVNARNGYGRVTPLMFASQQGHLDVVKILLKNGAEVDLKPRNDEGALIRATTMGHLEVAEELIRYGAHVNQTGILNRKALHYAAIYGHYYLADMLLYYNADINATSRYNVTPLMTAIAAGYPDIAELFVRKGADVTLSDSEGFTALMLASRYGFHKLAGLLLQKGAQPADTTRKNNTALSLSVAAGDLATSDTLLKYNADPNHSIKGNLSTMVLAKSIGNDSLYDLLKAKGGTVNMKPYFDYFVFRYDISVNNDDAIFGTHLGLHEIKSNTNVTMGFSLRYFAKRVYENQNDDVIHQYWERRYVLPLTVDKLFDLIHNYNKQFSVFAGVKGYYSWGRYRGLDAGPGGKFGISPRAGLFCSTSEVFALSLHYEYFELDQKTVSPHRFVLSFYLRGLLNETSREESKAEYIIRY